MAIEVGRIRCCCAVCDLRAIECGTCAGLPERGDRLSPDLGLDHHMLRKRGEGEGDGVAIDFHGEHPFFAVKPVVFFGLERKYVPVPGWSYSVYWVPP